MSDLKSMSKDERYAEYNKLLKEYNNYKDMGLKLDMSRGKPGAKQLDLSNELLNGVNDYHAINNLDIRNYGVLEGLPETRKIFGELFDIPADNIIIGEILLLNLFMIVSLCCFYSVLPEIHRGASFLKLKLFVLFRDMTDILPFVRNLALK